jgi:Fic family protein
MVFDINWDLVNGEVAHTIEVLNLENQANIIEGCVQLLKAWDGQSGEAACRLCPNIQVLKELHRAGTLFLLNDPGEFRTNYDVQVNKRDGTLYIPPPWQDVEALMAEFNTQLDKRWPASSPVEIAAFVLWRINSIHPFRNGNGRTARAFAYTLVCLKYGSMLRGEPTMIDLITQNRDGYESALGHADETFKENGSPDLAPMETYLEGLLRQQLLSVLEADEAEAAQ